MNIYIHLKRLNADFHYIAAKVLGVPFLDTVISLSSFLYLVDHGEYGRADASEIDGPTTMENQSGILQFQL